MKEMLLNQELAQVVTTWSNSTSFRIYLAETQAAFSFPTQENVKKEKEKSNCSKAVLKCAETDLSNIQLFSKSVASTEI